MKSFNFTNSKELTTHTLCLQEDGLIDVQAAMETDTGSDVIALKAILDSVSGLCANYVQHMSDAPPIGNTKLDRERQKLCLYELVSCHHFLSLITI